MCVLGGARFGTVLSSVYWVLKAPLFPCVIAVPFTGEQLQELLRSVYVQVGCDQVCLLYHHLSPIYVGCMVFLTSWIQL